MVRVLGIDPGTRSLGWGVIEQLGTRMVHVAHGTITCTSVDLADRLLSIDAGLAEVIRIHEPSDGAVETIFFAKNAQSAAKLGHARGVVLLRLRKAGLTVGEYTPAKVKRTVAGSGRADKHQVAMVVKALLRLPQPPQTDAADALALALTHLNIIGFERALRRS